MLSMYKYIFLMVILWSLTSIGYAQEAATVQVQANPEKTPLTLQEYQQCQARSELSNQQAQQLQEQQAELEQMKKQIAELTKQRENLGQSLDLHKLESVDQYNAVNQQLNNIINVYETEAKAYNQALKEYKQEVLALKQECDDRPYIEKN